MKHRLLYRIASVLLLLFCAGHTVGSLSGRSPDPAADAVLRSMRTVEFDFNGSQRTLYDIFFGFSMIVALFLLASALVAWRISSIAADQWATVAPLAWGLFAVQVVTAILAWRYFFAGPAVLTSLSALFLGLGAARTTRALAAKQEPA